MKFIINKNKFNNVLSVAANVIENNLNPFLNNIYIKAENNQLLFIFTNETISIKYFYKSDIKIEINGEVLINFKTLKGIISKLQNEDIIIEKIDNILKISNSTFSANVNTISLDDLVSIDFDIKNDIEFKLKAKTFKEIEKKLFHALLSKEEKASVANGVLFESNENKLNIAATNGYKISLLSENINSQNFKLVFDPDFIKFINKCNFDDDKELNFSSDNNKIVLQTEEMFVVSKLLLGNFPNIYIPFDIEVKYSFDIELKTFLNVIDHGIYIVNIDKMPIINIMVNKKTMEVKFSSIEIGTSFEKVEIKKYEGIGDISLTLNAKFLLTLLKAFDNGDITILIEDKNKQIILKQANNDSFKQLILPIRN